MFRPRQSIKGIGPKNILFGKQVAVDKIGKKVKLGIDGKKTESLLPGRILRLMDALPMFFETLKKKGLTRGHFLGFIHVLIGRRISRADGTLVSRGMAWRDVAGWLKKLRWDPEAVRELGQDPDALPPRDRQRFWFTAIAQAGIDSPAAVRAGDLFADVLRDHGFEVGSPPSTAKVVEAEKGST
jgi:hypothetical protein